MGVPFAAVQQKMSVDGTSQNSVLALPIINGSAQDHQLIVSNKQDHTNEFSMLPAIFAELKMSCHIVEMNALVQKLQGIEAQHQYIGDLLDEIERFENESRNTSLKDGIAVGNFSEAKELSVLCIGPGGLNANRCKGKQRRAVMQIQAFVRGVIQRVKYAEHIEELKLEKSVLIQRMVRGFLIKRIMRRKDCIPLSIRSAQCLIYNHVSRKSKIITRKAMRLRRRRIRKGRIAAIRIQALVRGFIQRTRYRAHWSRSHPPAGSLESCNYQLLKVEPYLAEYKEETKRDVEDAKFRYEQELVEYKEKIEDKLQAEERRHLSILDENAKNVEYLRGENKELRQQHDHLWKGCKLLKESISKQHKNQETTNSYMVQLTTGYRALGATNARLMKAIDKCKGRMAKMKAYQQKQESFGLLEAQSRVRYQKAIARIVAHVQDNGKDVQLLEDIVNLAGDLHSVGSGQS